MSSNTMARLFWLCLVAFTSAATADPFGTTEIDLVFPRNDTFSPMPMMPIVFAVQNPPVAKLLGLRLKYGLSPLGHANLSADFHDFDYLHNLPANDTATYFVYTEVGQRVNTESTWEFWWRLESMNCSISHDPKWKDNPYGPWDQVKDGFHWQENAPYNSVVFTTHKGGREPDLVAISSGDDCDKAQGIAYDVLGILKTPRPLNDYGKPSCAQLATPTPTPYPCQASVGPAAASSISSRLTQRECSIPTPAVSCPPKHTTSAGNLDRGRSGWIIAAFAWLLISIV